MKLTNPKLGIPFLILIVVWICLDPCLCMAKILWDKYHLTDTYIEIEQPLLINEYISTPEPQNIHINIDINKKEDEYQPKEQQLIKFLLTEKVI